MLEDIKLYTTSISKKTKKDNTECSESDNDNYLKFVLIECPWNMKNHQ